METEKEKSEQEKIQAQNVPVFIVTNILAGGLAFIGNLLFSWIYNKIKKKP